MSESNLSTYLFSYVRKYHFIFRRRSLKAKPPPAKVGDVNDPANDRRYSDLSREQIPLSESLKDCNDRIRPLWKYKISRELRRGNNVLVVGHANSLRGLAKIIDGKLRRQ